MNLEKIGLLFLINYFNQLGEVKNHLLAAVREVLLAIQSSFEIVSESTTKSLLGDKAELLSPVLRQVQGVINYSIQKVSPSIAAAGNMSLEEGLKLKEHIVDSIISAIDDEIENIRGISNDKNKLKVDALHTVKQVLINQKAKPVATAAYSARDKKANVA